MKDFKSVVYARVFSRDQVHGGDVALGNTPNEVTLPVESLRQDLELLRRSHTRYFYCLVGFVLSIFLVALFVSTQLLKDPGQVTALFVVTCVLVAGSIAVMTKLWKEKTAIDITLALLSSMKAEVLQTVLEVMIRKF